MHYKKYEVRSPFFALKDARVREAMLAPSSAATVKPALAPAQRKALPRIVHVKRQPR